MVAWFVIWCCFIPLMIQLRDALHFKADSEIRGQYQGTKDPLFHSFYLFDLKEGKL